MLKGQILYATSFATYNLHGYGTYTPFLPGDGMSEENVLEVGRKQERRQSCKIQTGILGSQSFTSWPGRVQ